MSLVLGADTITNPNLPNWEISRVKYAGSLVAETVISELTTNTTTNPNFANRDASRSRVAETVVSELTTNTTTNPESLIADLGTEVPNPNLPNWNLSRIECAGSRVAETVISELTANTITNPSNFPKRGVAKSRIAETLIADLGTEVPNPNLPNWDLSRIECAGSRVAETVISELTRDPNATVNPRLAPPPLALHGGTYVAVEMTNLRAWLRENYEPDPNAVMEREEVQKHWLTANGFNPSTVSNLLSFQIKMGKAINIEFGSCGKLPFCVNGPRKLEGKKLKNLYKGLKRKE